MIKLYKTIDGVLHYHEAWAHDSMIIEHWGIVGEPGETTEHERDDTTDEDKSLTAVLDAPLQDGFEEIDEDDMPVAMIEYAVEGFGTTDDLDKRHELENRMNETLGWTGLGHCDGGSIGSGTMEIFCPVVDFNIAQKVIEEDLADTGFADYTRIGNMRVV